MAKRKQNTRRGHLRRIPGTNRKVRVRPHLAKNPRKKRK